MRKCLNLIKKYRAGNRILVETEYTRTLSLRRRNAEEPICRVELKDKGERLLLDVLAILGAVWAVSRLIRTVGRLFRG